MSTKYNSYRDLIDPAWNELLDSIDSQEAWEAAQQRHPYPVITLWAAYFCQYEVCNGGFLQLFKNSFGFVAPEAQVGYEAVGMPVTAGIVRTACAELGEPYPRIRSDRWDRLLLPTGKTMEERNATLATRGGYLAINEIMDQVPEPPAFKALDKQFYLHIETENGGFDTAANAYVNSLADSHRPGAPPNMTDLVRKQLQQSLDTLTRVLHDESIHTTVVEAGRLTAEAMKSGKKLMVCGNGGSAADAQHLVAEFVSRLTVDRPALRAIALTTDTSILTAIGNDYSYDNVFERQVEALANPGDVLLAISTSGNSKNCVKALKLARSMGVRTVAYTGNDGGAMKEHAELNVIIPSKTTMNIQESHLALEHIFCMVVERFYFGEDFGSKPQQLAE